MEEPLGNILLYILMYVVFGGPAIMLPIFLIAWLVGLAIPSTRYPMESFWDSIKEKVKTIHEYAGYCLGGLLVFYLVALLLGWAPPPKYDPDEPIEKSY